MQNIRIGRILTAVAAVAASLLLIIWVLVAQPSMPVSRKSPAASGAEAARLEAHVRALSVDMLPRDSEHPKNLDRAAAYIKRQFEGAGGRVTEQVYEFKEWDVHNKKMARGPFRNIVASFGPDTAERLVVGAHYDAYGPFPGADDNASGAAGLLELARLLGRRPPLLRTELVAFTLEEPPYFATEFMGSVKYAEALKKDGVRVRAMLCLEMIGAFTEAPKSQGYPIPLLKLFYPSRGNFITVVGKGDLNRAVKRAMMEVSDLPVHSIAAPAAVPGVDYSDHRSFWERGYPAVMISDTAFYRNHRYHTAQDTADLLDYRRMAQVIDGTEAALRALAR